jgi:hypothetical protein
VKTIIAGSRGIYLTVHEVDAIVRESGFEVTEVVSGGALGVDRAGEGWASRISGVKLTRMPADWTNGKRGGPLRNEEMAKYAEALIAVWDGKSPGTADMIRRAEKHGLKIYKVIR